MISLGPERTTLERREEVVGTQMISDEGCNESNSMQLSRDLA